MPDPRPRGTPAPRRRGRVPGGRVPGGGRGAAAGRGAGEGGGRGTGGGADEEAAVAAGGGRRPGGSAEEEAAVALGRGRTDNCPADPVRCRARRHRHLRPGRGGGRATRPAGDGKEGAG